MTNTQKLGIGATGIIAAVIGMKIIATSFNNILHVTNQQELYDAFRKAEIEPVTKIVVDVSEMNIDSTVHMNRMLASRGNTLILDFQGCALIPTNAFYERGDSVVLERRPDMRYKQKSDTITKDDQAFSHKYMMDNNVVMSNGAIIAQRKKKTIGISYCSAFGGGLNNFFIYGCTIAAEFRFNLMGYCKQVRATESSYIGFLVTIGNWSGADYINSQSNVFRMEQTRSKISDGAYASFIVYQSACCINEQSISEGGTPDYHYIFDGKGSPLVRENTLNTFYVEAVWKKACIKEAPSGGIATANNLWVQPTSKLFKGALIDGTGSKAGSQINITNTGWITGQEQFLCDSTTNSGRWRIDNILADWDTSTFWVNGKLPVSYYGTILKGGRNSMIYNGYSINFNKQKLNPTALLPKQ